MIIHMDNRETFELSDDFYVNPDGWFRRTFLIEINWSNTCTHQFVVEADYESEAIDTLLDSKFGYLFTVSNEEMEEYEDEWQKSEESETMALLDWLETHKDVSFGGNAGTPYHSDMFMVGYINRCKVEGFRYEETEE